MIRPMIRPRAGRVLPQPRRTDDRGELIAIAMVAAILLVASSAPSPLFVTYPRLLQFTTSTVMAAILAYVFCLSLPLLLIARHGSRRADKPILLMAIALETCSLLFLDRADDVGMLLAARVLHGMGTGLAMAVLGLAAVHRATRNGVGRIAGIHDIAPPAALAVAALASGALIHHGPTSSHLLYRILWGLLLLAAVAAAVLPDPRSQRADHRRHRGYSRPVPTMSDRPGSSMSLLLAAWSLISLFLSLGPAVVSGPVGVHIPFTGALMVVLFCGPGLAAVFTLRAADPDRILLWSPVLMAVGTAGAVLGVQTSTLTPAITGVAIAGVGFGGTVLIVCWTVARSAQGEPGQVSRAVTTAVLLAYAASSVTAVLVGLAGTAYGLLQVAGVHAVLVIVLSALAVAGRLLPSSVTARL